MNLPNPEVALTKAKLVRRIRDLMTQRKLTQVSAATLLGIDQSITGEPAPEPPVPDGKDPAAVALGRKGSSAVVGTSASGFAVHS